MFLQLIIDPAKLLRAYINIDIIYKYRKHFIDFICILLLSGVACERSILKWIKNLDMGKFARGMMSDFGSTFDQLESQWFEI